MRTEEKNNETNGGRSERRNCQRKCFHTQGYPAKKNQIFLFYASFVCRFYAFYANVK